MNPNPLRRCWAEVDLGALRSNLSRIAERAGVALMPILKANAYGHGLEQVAESLAGAVSWVGVANTAEALRVQEVAGRETFRILILSPLTPDERETAVRHGLSCSVSSVEEVTDFGRRAAKTGGEARLHAVADTGMGRMGAAPGDWENLLRAIGEQPGCRLEGVATHFPNADEDAAFTRDQIDHFRSMTRGLGCEIHLANSAGILGFSELTPFATLARPGLVTYGIAPIPVPGLELTPVMTLKSRITLVRSVGPGTTISYGSTFVTERPMTVASVAVGYGDGYPRHLSGTGASVLIAGKRCPLLGRVTMDQIVVDAGALGDTPAAGDEVVLMGRMGDEEIGAVELAEKSGTIAWEILTSISSRVERIYR